MSRIQPLTETGVKERFRYVVFLASFLLVVSSSPVVAEYIEPTLELTAVRVEVTWIANGRELAEIRKRYESRLQRSWGTSGGVHGNRPDDGIRSFAVLGKRDGDWVCLIFVERPKTVNDSHTLELGHELAHCFFGAYHAFL